MKSPAREQLDKAVDDYTKLRASGAIPGHDWIEGRVEEACSVIEVGTRDDLREAIYHSYAQPSPRRHPHINVTDNCINNPTKSKA